MPRPLSALLALLYCAPALALLADEPKDPSAKTDADFAFQGEYVGPVQHENETVQVGVQVIARGKGKFVAKGFHGGLPGAGWDQDKSKVKEAPGELVDGAVVIKGEEAQAVIQEGVLTISIGDKEVGKLKKVARHSPTLGAAPPEGAIILFDGKSADEWQNGRLDADGYLMQGITSKRKFQDHSLHLEFRIPYEPEKSGQGRGNSGLYLQGRYEVQMLDSFGLEGKNNECGGIYSIKDCDLNMCLPPLAWQTYDIDFTAARYDAEGKLVANPRITVRHNGVVIHKDVELPKSTTAAPMGPGAAAGPIYLQDHGNQVRYRNIWVVEKK